MSDGKKYLNLGVVDAELRERLDAFAKAKSLSTTAAARMLLTEALDAHGVAAPPKTKGRPKRANA